MSKGGEKMPRKNGNKPMNKEMAKSGMHKMPNGTMMKNSEMKKTMKKPK
jgi:hypothetical protein